MNSKVVRRRGESGQSLIGMIIVIAIILGMTYYMYGAHGNQKDMYSSATDQANQVACGVYTGQIRDAISMYKQDHDGANPPDLDALKTSRYGVMNEMIHSPGCEYGYDPSTGTVLPPGRGGAAVPSAGGGGAVNPTSVPDGGGSGPHGPGNGPGGVRIPDNIGNGSLGAGGGSETGTNQ